MWVCVRFALNHCRCFISLHTHMALAFRLWLSLVRGGHGPRALHPPHRERVAESLVRDVAAAGHLAVHLVALQHLTEEVDVAGSQFERLDLAQLVGGQSGDDLAQRRERLVQWLSPLALAYVGQHALILQLLVGLRAARTCLLAPFSRTGTSSRAVLLARLFTRSPLSGEAPVLLLALQFLLTGPEAVHRRHGRTRALFHFSLKEMQGHGGKHALRLRIRGVIINPCGMTIARKKGFKSLDDPLQCVGVLVSVCVYVLCVSCTS